MKRFIAMAVAAVVMASGFVVPVMGSNIQQGTNAHQGLGSIQIREIGLGVRVEAIRVLDMSVRSVPGTAFQRIAYTINPNFNDFFAARTVNGQSITTGRLAAEYITALATVPAEYAAFATAVREYVLTNQIDWDYEITNENAQGVVTMHGVELGHYLVFAGAQTSLLANLTSTTPDVCLTFKPETPEVEKEVRIPTAGLEQIRIYDVTSSVPDVNGFNHFTWILHDEMSVGLTFNDDVRIIVDGNTLTRNVDFTVVDALSTDTVRNPGGTAITITLTNPLALFSSATVGSEIHVVYSATINEYAVTGVDGNPNVVRVQYSNDRFNNSEYGETPRDDQSTATVFTFDLELVKVDALDNTMRLEDAIFSLYTTTHPTDGEGNPITTVEQRDHEGTTLFLISDTLRSDNNGIVRWLRNGNPYDITIGAGTFYLFETHAPAGFYRMYEPIIFEVDADVDGNTLNSVTVTSNDVNFDVQNNRVIRALVENVGDEYGLPSTGGIGRTIFMTVGGIVILGSLAGMLISNRKKVKESQ